MTLLADLRNRATRAYEMGIDFNANESERWAYEEHLEETILSKYINQDCGYAIKAVARSKTAINAKQGLLLIRKFTGIEGIEQGGISSAFSKLHLAGLTYVLNVKKGTSGIEVMHFIPSYFVFKKKFVFKTRLTHEEQHIKTLRVLRSAFSHAAIETKVDFVEWVKDHSSREEMKEEWARRQN